MNAQQVAENNNYNSLKEHPESLLKLVDKYVKVDIIKNCSYVGFVHSFDPVTHSIILLVADGDTFKPTLLPGHAVINVIEVPSQINTKPERKQASTDTLEDIMTKKTRLIAWFKSNLLPVTELEDAIVLGNVKVLPPYNTSDVCTDNPIVALQIKKVMQSMPEHYA